MADSLHLLLGVLDDLRAAELKRFRLYLTSGELVGYPRIPQGRLESNDQTDIASKMLETYGRDDSLKITQDILTMIDRRDLAERLRRASTTSTEDQDRHPFGTGTPRSKISDDATLSGVLTAYRAKMRRSYKSIFEGLEERKNLTELNRIYTELYIMEDFDGANAGHEVLKLEQAHKMTNVHERPISFRDIFKSDSRQRGCIRTVLTKGIAGIGKTMAVHKFTLDWAEGVSHQEVDFIFVLPFRGLNQVKDDRYSLHGLLQHFHPELQGLEDPTVYTDTRVVFILDGLDESRLALDFACEAVSDVRKKTSVEVLITNLIQENLLPSALIWITTRPAAAKQIPPSHVHKWTEVLGFNEQQQKEYFNKRLGDQSQKVLAYIKTSRSLQALCHIPVFCWILATVLPKILNSDHQQQQQQQLGQQVPVTLTEVFISFLVIQMGMKHLKYQGSSETSRQKLLEENKAMILRLARLAFQGLKTGTLLFEDKDLKTSGMLESEASLYAGVCTEVFVEESALFTKKVYCFVHLSVQEFLAALHVFYAFMSGKLLKDDSFIDWIPKRDLTEQYKLNVLLKVVIDMCFENDKGHLDLLLRFLLGMSLESNQKLLLGILPRLVTSAEVEDQREGWRKVLKPTEYIRSKLEGSLSTERALNFLCCLHELKDSSLQSEVQGFLKAEKLSDRELSVAHCTALADMILMSEDILDELDLTKYNASFRGYARLMPAVKCCRKAKLSRCATYDDHVQVVSEALKSVDCQLCELDISNNPLFHSGIELLCSGLADPHCKLVKLWLSSCGLSSEDCGTLVTALQTGSSLLRELDLSHNDLQDSGVELLLQKLLKSPWRLSRLRLADCGLTRKSCETLATVLQSAAVNLNDLDLGSNQLKDEGVTTLSAGLLHPYCKLKTLRLAGCGLTRQSCESVAIILQSSAADLNELDLGSNPLKDLGVTTLFAGLVHPHCKVKTLRLAECDLTEASCKTLAKVMLSASSPLKRLELPGNRLGDAGAKYLSEALTKSHCWLESLILCRCHITERGCEYLASSLSSSQSSLTELDLRHNDPGRAKDKLLSIQGHHPQRPLKINVNSLDGVRKYACDLTLDVNTVHKALFLCEGNRGVDNHNSPKRFFSYPAHPERFTAGACCAQVLCCQALSGCHYWEVTYRGTAVLIGVAYKYMCRSECNASVIGKNEHSWSIYCNDSNKGYIVKHCEQKPLNKEYSPSRRIGVYLDWPSGELSFYSVSSDTLTHLHTFRAKFTAPLYPGFCVYEVDSSLTICQLK